MCVSLRVNTPLSCFNASCRWVNRVFPNLNNPQRPSSPPPPQPLNPQTNHPLTLLVQIRMQGAGPLVAQHMREVPAGLAEAEGMLLLPIVGQGPRKRQAADFAHRHGVEAGAEAVGWLFGCWGGGGGDMLG